MVRPADGRLMPIDLSLPKSNLLLRLSGVVGDAQIELARKADICAKVLAEARKLALAGQFGTLTNQLVGRAGELLDDMDDILVALHPARDGPSFAIAASLHRELENVQMIITRWRRRQAAPRNAAGKW
jgi:hypothetical protein